MPKLKEPISTNKTKRKKDGVFYTQNTLPSTLSTIPLVNSVPRKGELGIIDEEYASRKNRQATTIIKLEQQLKDYANGSELTICTRLVARELS
jgi:hypothetical protein